MNPKAMRRLVNRVVVARKALEGNVADIPAFHKTRLDDALIAVGRLEESLLREIGDPPSAAKRREL